MRSQIMKALAVLGGILFTLGIIRVMVVRWSPTQTRLSAYSYMPHADEGGHP